MTRHFANFDIPCCRPTPPFPLQELFLRSSLPKAALEMRKDLKHWSEALKLADQLDPESIPSICKEHAASLEMTGEYSNAKGHYQQVGAAGRIPVGRRLLGRTIIGELPNFGQSAQKCSADSPLINAAPALFHVVPAPPPPLPGYGLSHGCL